MALLHCAQRCVRTLSTAPTTRMRSFFAPGGATVGDAAALTTTAAPKAAGEQMLHTQRRKRRGGRCVWHHRSKGHQTYLPPIVVHLNYILQPTIGLLDVWIELRSAHRRPVCTSSVNHRPRRRRRRRSGEEENSDEGGRRQGPHRHNTRSLYIYLDRAGLRAAPFNASLSFSFDGIDLSQLLLVQQEQEQQVYMSPFLHLSACLPVCMYKALYLSIPISECMYVCMYV